MIFGDEIPITGVTLTPRRPTFDAMGNITKLDDLEPLENCVVIVNPLPRQGGRFDAGGAQYTQTGVLYARRDGTRLRNADQVTYLGRNYFVMGDPEMDTDHPLTGDDFGYVMYSVHWGG